MEMAEERRQEQQQQQEEEEEEEEEAHPHRTEPSILYSSSETSRAIRAVLLCSYTASIVQLPVSTPSAPNLILGYRYTARRCSTWMDT
jgi:hypothetical protein